MQERHTNRSQYFSEQAITTTKYVMPYISDYKAITKELRVLEIGCGEGGNLAPFIDLGCEVVGIDLSSKRIEEAKQFTSEHYHNSKAIFINQDIYRINAEELGRFDLIMLRDVIEHIHNQDQFFKHLKVFLKQDGLVFFGFPPWCMPFGGHQQVCKSKLLSKTPYFHLLPNTLYKGVLKLFGETERTVNSLVEIKETGIGINKFLQLVKNNKYAFVKKTLYFINPNYEVKFGLKQRVQFKTIAAIPYLRDFFSTCLYCVIRLKEQSKPKRILQNSK